MGAPPPYSNSSTTHSRLRQASVACVLLLPHARYFSLSVPELAEDDVVLALFSRFLEPRHVRYGRLLLGTPRERRLCGLRQRSTVTRSQVPCEVTNCRAGREEGGSVCVYMVALDVVTPGLAVCGSGVSHLASGCHAGQVGRDRSICCHSLTRGDRGCPATLTSVSS